MEKNVVTKVLIIVVLILLIVNNLSYAANITKDNLKKSLAKMFASDIEIKMETKSDIGTSSSTMNYTAPSEVNVTDSQILLKEIEEGQEMVFEIDYLIEDNKVKYFMEANVSDFNPANDEEAAMFVFAILMMEYESMQLAYLSTAEALGIDLEIANSYYSQLINENNSEMANEISTDENTDIFIENELFKYVLKYDVDNLLMETELHIDVDKLSVLNEDMLDGTIDTTITFLNTPKEDEDDITNNTNIENNVNNVVNNAIENKVSNNVVNNTLTNNTIENKMSNNVLQIENSNNTANTNKDNTVADKIIPAAGESRLIVFLFCMIVLSVRMYIKMKQYDEIN